MPKDNKHGHLAIKIFIGMVLGILVGVIINLLPQKQFLIDHLVYNFLDVIGSIFLNLMRMMVIPVVFVSLVCGTSNLGHISDLGRMGVKTLGLYILTTSIAITLALTIAALLSVGKGTELTISANFVIKQAPSIKDTIIDLFPVNPFEAVVEGKMLQVIVFSIFFGIAITMTGKAGNSVKQFFNALNEIVMTLIMFLMHVAPYGVFCLIASLFAEMGYSVIIHLFNYFFTVLLVLLIHLLLTNSILLKFLARLSPITFFKKIYSAMIFAFSTSSSSVSIPVVLETVEKKLGVNNSVASFIIPLGATINMDGTAIMQGVATVFIAHAYNIPIGLLGYIQVVAIATLASIGTAGVPGVGLITLTMVLRQVGLPVEGISLIIGVDRLLDMARTAVNITGDSTISCVISRSENAFDRDIFDSPDPD